MRRQVADLRARSAPERRRRTPPGSTTCSPTPRRRSCSSRA